MAKVNFFTEDVDFSLSKPRKTSAWLSASAAKEKFNIASLSYIFCNDSFLLDINQRFLNHNSLTDVITFDYSEKPAELAGEIYISIQRIGENAAKFNTTFDDELHRVMIHGALHLMGYLDKTPAAKALMRKKEEAYLSLR